MGSKKVYIKGKKPNIEIRLNESIGGAGYAVYGGGPGSFGNARGGGFGQSSSNGGPNLMYTYNIVPLNQVLQQRGTPQGTDRYIHVGSEIKGKLLGKDKEIEGKIIEIVKDEENNINYYIVLATKTAEKLRVDPTSVELISHEERPDIYMRDLVGENYYPLLNDFLKEEEIKSNVDSETDDVKGKVERSKKIPKEIKDKIFPLIAVNTTKYNNGRVFRLNIPKIDGKSFDGVDLGADKDGFFVFTHRARSKSKSEISKIPKKDIEFIKSTG